jgi:hypothetical protein
MVPSFHVLIEKFELCDFIHGICFVFVEDCRAFDAHMANIGKARTIVKKLVVQCLYDM